MEWQSNMTERYKLSEDHKIVYISGLGDTLTVAKRHASKLSCYLYDESWSKPSRVDLILNTSSLTIIDGHEIKKIRDYIFKAESQSSSLRADEINLVFFAHSLGAKVLLEALKFVNVDFGNATERFARIRKHIAVFCFGGVVLISKNMAAIVQNFRFHADCKANLASLCCFYTEREQFENRRAAYHVSSPIPGGGSGDPSCLCACVTCRCRHSMDEYLSEEHMLDRIVATLECDTPLSVVSTQP